MVGFREVPLLKVMFSFMVFSQKSRRQESNVNREKKKNRFLFLGLSIYDNSWQRRLCDLEIGLPFVNSWKVGALEIFDQYN